MLVDWRPEPNGEKEAPAPAKAAKEPQDIESNEQLYLTGLHLEQYRHATYDPRPSVAERYSSLSHFVDAVRLAAERLVQDQLLLQMDVDSVVERATRNYTAITEHSDGHEQAV